VSRKVVGIKLIEKEGLKWGKNKIIGRGSMVGGLRVLLRYFAFDRKTIFLLHFTRSRQNHKSWPEREGEFGQKERGNSARKRGVFWGNRQRKDAARAINARNEITIKTNFLYRTPN